MDNASTPHQISSALVNPSLKKSTLKFTDLTKFRFLSALGRVPRTHTIENSIASVDHVESIDLTWGHISQVYRRASIIDHHPYTKFHQHCSIHVRQNGLYILLIWINSLNLVSLDRAPWEKSKIAALFRPGNGRVDAISKAPFAPLDSVGAYRSGLELYFTTFGPQWPSP